MVAIPRPSVAESLPSIDPATGKILKTFEKTAPQSVPALLAKCRAAQARWAKLPIEKRCAQLKALRAKILEVREELTDAVVRESGKPRTEAKFADVFVSLDSADYFAKNAAKMLVPESVPHHSLAAKAKTGKLIYEPLGVVAIISSWNYPLAIPMSQIIAAVVAGNGVMSKASDFTPECGEWIGRLFREAGFPPDLVTILQGGGDVGQALIEAHPDKVFFYGQRVYGTPCCGGVCAAADSERAGAGRQGRHAGAGGRGFGDGLERRGVGQLFELRAGVPVGGAIVCGRGGERGVHREVRGEDQEIAAGAGE